MDATGRIFKNTLTFGARKTFTTYAMPFRVAHILHNAFTTHGFPCKHTGGENAPAADTEIGVKFVPAGAYSCYPIPHVAYFPIGSGACYLHKYGAYYEKFVFVCDFGDIFVVGWYYKRHLEPETYPRDEDWKHLFDQDTRLNTDSLVLKARDAQGEFIRGKVWLACFGFTNARTRVFNPYRSVPRRIIHARGWEVPSWALTPSATLIQPNLVVKHPYSMPLYEDLARQRYLVLVKIPTPCAPSEETEDAKRASPPTVEVPAVRLCGKLVEESPVVLPTAYIFK